MKNRGFTLMEILIVVIIVGIVVASSLVSYTKVIQQERARAAIIQLRQLQSAIKMYQARYGANALPDTTGCSTYEAAPWCSEDWMDQTFGTDLQGEEGVMHYSFANQAPYTVDNTKYIIRAHWPYNGDNNTGWIIQMTTAYPDPCCCLTGCWDNGSDCPITLPTCNGYGQ